MTERKRIEAIDILKGIAIIAVVLGHVLTDHGFLNAWVYSFQVPLFFFAAGLVFSAKFRSTATPDAPTFGAFVVKRARQLMVPYAAFGVLAIIIYQVMGTLAATMLGRGAADLTVVQCLGGLIYGNAAMPELFFYRPLWFLPCLFVMEILMGAVLFCARNMRSKVRTAANTAKAGNEAKAALVFGVSVVASVAGFAYMHLVGVPQPWGAETACILMPFFAAGQALRLLVPPVRLEEVLAKTPRRRAFTALAGVALLAAAVALAWVNFSRSDFQSVSYVANNYRLIWAFFASAALHCAALTALCFAIVHCKPLAYLGKHTLYILGLHKYPILAFQILPLTAGALAANNIALAAVVVVFALGFSLAGEYVVRRGYTALKSRCSAWATRRRERRATRATRSRVPRTPRTPRK